MSAENNSNLLIDFNSPAEVKFNNRKPLIPMPCVKGDLVVSATNDNPFDIVATQSENSLLQNDPFEFVLKASVIEDKPNDIDFPLEGDIKAVINSRVNKCIQRVLNSSGVTEKLNKTTDDLKENKTFKSTWDYRRSFSTSLLGKEFPQNSDKNFCKKITKFKSSSSSYSSQSTDYLNKGFLASASSNENNSKCLREIGCSDNSVFVPNDELIFEEAETVANSIIQQTSNYLNGQPSGDDSYGDSDLMSCKPDFLYADSSEDEAEILRKDPSLNFHSSTLITGLSQSFTKDVKIESEALSRFKNRLSMDKEEKPSQLPENMMLQRSSSWAASATRKIAPPQFHIPVAVVNHEETQNEKPLRVKKILPEPVRRGPLKAVMPIQNMTKPVDQKGGNIPREKISPEHLKPCATLSVVTPIKKDNSMKAPMAASTPSKSHSATVLMDLSPIPQMATKQIRSQNVKKLSAIPKNAMMKNSNSSINSSLSSNGVSRIKSASPKLQVTKAKVSEMCS